MDISRGRICTNNHGQVNKDYDYIIDDKRTEQYLNGHYDRIAGGYKSEIALGYQGYCHNCVEGRSEPLYEREGEEFLEGYLGEHER